MARTSKWCFIVYPDSAPENWITILDSYHIPSAISPLHQPETDDEEQLKPHYHVILDFGDNKKADTQILEISREALKGTYPKIIMSPIGYYEYLIHKNNPEKEQFTEGFKAITHLNGFDLEKYQKIDKEDKLPNGFLEVLTVIEENNITEIYQITQYCLQNDMDLLIPLRRDNHFFNNYLRSKRAFRREYGRE